MAQHISIVGNLVADPERRSTQAGDAFASFRVACSDRIRDAGGAWIDGPTSFYSVTAYSALGEHALASLARGQRVVVRGTLHVREWRTAEKSGVTADIRADAVGHDLKWGTSLFSRDGRAGDAASDDREAPPAPGGDEPTGRDGVATASSDLGLGVPTGWAPAAVPEEAPF